MNSFTELLPKNVHDTDSLPVVEHVYVQRGSPCPHCGAGELDYNGLLDLECDHCGYSLVEAAGCS